MSGDINSLSSEINPGAELAIKAWQKYGPPVVASHKLYCRATHDLSPGVRKDFDAELLRLARIYPGLISSDLPKGVVMYSGTIAFDEPDRKPRSDAGTSKWPGHNNVAWKRAWREKHRAHLRTYMREYMRRYRARKRA